MDIEMAWYVQIGELEERQHVFASMASPGVMEHLAGSDVQRGEQIDGAIALVVMRHRPPTPRLHPQRRLSPVQRLNPGFFIELGYASATRSDHRDPGYPSVK